MVHEKAWNCRLNNIHDEWNDRPDAETFVYDSLCNKVFQYMAGW